MKDQLKTIRAGIAAAIDSDTFIDKPVRRALLDALTALAQIEQAVGSVEKCVESEREVLRAAQAKAVMPLVGPLLDAWESCAQDVRDQHPELDKQLRQIDRAMQAAPPAQQPRLQVGDSRFESWYSEDFDPKNKGTKQQMREAYEAGMNDKVAQQPQYEAGDVASAAAQGFRGGVASVAQQPQAITPAELAKRIERGEKWQVDQQPQAEPDFTHSKTAPTEIWKNRFNSLAERLEMADGAVAFEREVVANLREKLAQAEAVIDKCSECGKTSTKDSMWALYCVECIENKIAPALAADQPPAATVQQRAEGGVEAHMHHYLPIGTKLYAAPHQAEAVQRGEYQRNILTSVSNWMRTRAHASWAEKFGYSGLMKAWADDLQAIAAPQQAEAVPSDVVRDAEGPNE